MYRILIADDEKDERNVIRFLLKKFNFELEIVEATNGKEALAHLKEQPTDILFTDVKMPFIDGIELATKVREFYPEIEIIFFSGHDDFDFIKKALSLKADNYILKPIKPTEFQNTIQTVLKSIKNNEVQKDFFKKSILQRLLNQTSINTLENDYVSMDLSFLNDYSRIILMRFEEPFADKLSKEADRLYFYEQIKTVIPKYALDLVELNPYNIVLFFKHKSNTLVPYMQLAEKIQKLVLSEYGVNCYISVSNEFSTPSEISAVYDELEEYIQDCFFYDDTYICPINSSEKDNKQNQEEDEYQLQAILKAIQYVDSEKLKQHIDILLQKYEKKVNRSTSHVYVRFLFSRLLQMLYQEKLSYNKEAINKKIEAIYSFKHFSEIKDTVTYVGDEVIKKIKEAEDSPKHVIEVVKQYIDENFGEDLNLNLLAEKVYLTPGYLSEKFIQETGTGINKYIKNIRMKNAERLLLSTNMKVSDISKNVGYQNFSYFCRSFREYYGNSPDKHRLIQRKKNTT
ncbi:response regulator transcription factor [Piscibacillus halophilus]|uniref:response regulator transcription factor n=1 Tax=Piscibacillus halophilus TaxID=571933 RepID=UPI002408F285|nr:response regulator [Piscibacillus halophilus]